MNINKNNSILNEIGELVDCGSEIETMEKLQAANRLKMIRNEAKSPNLVFPVEAFPKVIQALINTFSNCYGFPTDYYGTSFLTVSGAILGNAFEAEYKYGWTAKPLIYAAIVGPSSIGKSYAMKTAMKPCYNFEEHFQNEFNASMIDLDSGEPEPPPPKELLINDATIEAINTSLKNNRRGLLYFKDELSGWVNSMNQYRKGTDQEFWLQNWQSTTIKVNRQGKHPVYIKAPFVSVFGALTPNFLKSLASGGRADNGFLARILFAYPDNMSKPFEADELPDPRTFRIYERIIKNLYHFPNNITNTLEGENSSITIPLSDEARVLFKAFLRKNTIAINNSDDDTIASIYGKMDSYCLRFALIIELLQIACNKLVEDHEDFPSFSQSDDFAAHKISKSSVEKAILLSEYYKLTAFKVVERFESPINSLSPDQKAWYQSLPDEFSTSLAKEIGEKAELSSRIISRLLNNSKTETPIFKRKGRGIYEKLFV